jgi:hypothetical protein
VEYRVKWEIEIAAETPQAAARLAKQYQTEPTRAVVFDVTDPAGDTVTVDLEDLGPCLPQSRQQAVEQILRDLLEWEQRMGGWDAPAWQRARRFAS